MKVSLERAYDAYVALMKISKQAVQSDIAFKMYSIKKKLADQYEFYNEQQTKLIEQFKGDVHENGLVAFEDKAHRQQFEDELKKMRKMDVEIDCEAISVPVNIFKEISVGEIEALEDFIEFKDRGDDK